MLLARLQHEVEDLKRKVEETKMKLAAEMKVGGSQVHSVNTTHAQRWWLLSAQSVATFFLNKYVNLKFSG